MLPVASPQHAADYGPTRGDFRDIPAYADPIETGLGMGEFQETHGEYQELQTSNHLGGVNSYNAAAPSPVGHQPGVTVDLESFKHQKIHEFRQALEYELERKRQQAQKQLEDAEREKWQSLMDFQQALQGEMEQSSLPTQCSLPTHAQYYGDQVLSPLHQHSMMPSSISLPQHAMLGAPNSAQPYSMDQQGMSNAMQQLRLGGLQSSVMAGSPMHHPLPSPASSMQAQSSPMRQTNMVNPLGYMQQQQQQQQQPGMSKPASPHHRYVTQDSTRFGSPMRPIQSSGTPGYSMYQQQGLARDVSPMRQQHIGASKQQYGMARTGSPMRQQYVGMEDVRQPYNVERSTSPARLPPPSSLYNEPPGSPSRMTNMSPQRPPTIGEMQSHLQPHRRGGRDDIWRARDQPETFKFDNIDEIYDRRLAKSAGVENTARHHSPRERIHASSTWNPTSPTRNRASPPRGAVRQQERLVEAEQLEKEYAKLTSKRSSSKSTALWNVKKMQEARRRKLEALTARVVHNRRRLAHEMKTADRPLEIAFVDSIAKEMNAEDNPDEIYEDSREEPQSSHIHRSEIRNSHGSRIRQSKTRDSQSTRIHHNGTRQSTEHLLAAVAENEEITETDEGGGPTEDEAISSETEQLEDDTHEGVLSRSDGDASYEKESTSEEKDVSSKEGGEFLHHAQESESEASKGGKDKSQDKPDVNCRIKSSKTRERKGEKKAKDFVAKLRQKRSTAKETASDQAVSKTYSREQVLAALGTGKKDVTLPTRDPKLARKNRKLQSQKLVESNRDERNPSRGRSAKIAIKKSMSSTTQQAEVVIPRQDSKRDNYDHHASPGTKKHHERTCSSEIEATPTKIQVHQGHGIRETQRKKNTRASSGISLISDLSESAYGVAPSYTGSAVDFNANGNYEYEEGTEDSTTSVFQDINSGNGSLSDDPYGPKEDIGRKKLRIKVEAPRNSASEGFEVEEGFDLNSIYSRAMSENPDATEEAYKDTLKDLEALKDLERKLDAEDRRNFLTELKTATEIHGWDVNTAVKHFAARFFPQLTNDAELEDVSLNSLLQLPAKAAQYHDSSSPTTSPAQLPPSNAQLPSSHRPTSPESTAMKSRSSQPKPPRSTPKSPPTDRRFTLVNPPDPISPSSSGSGWRSRIRNNNSIDMGDVRTSLRSLSRRQRHANKRGTPYKPELQSLEER